MAKKELKANKDIKNKKSFLKGVKAELKKVIWPTPKQLVNNTVAVITIVLITAIIVFILDFTFETINKNGIEKIKSVIETTKSEDESTNTNSEESNNSVTDNTVDENVTQSNDENTTNNVDNDVVAQ